MKFPIFATFMVLALSAPLTASANERTGVLQAISNLFKAMETRDLELTRSVMMPAGELMSGDDQMSVDAQGTEFAEYMKDLDEGDELLQERLIKPEVMVSGNIAVVWSDYQFFVDGKLSHCGVDNFSLMKVQGEWRLMYATFTFEQSARCSTMAGKNWINGHYILN